MYFLFVNSNRKPTELKVTVISKPKIIYKENLLKGIRN